MSANLDNPAGRLHRLLTALEAQEASRSVLTAWGRVLGITKEEALLRLGSVAILVPEIHDAVEGRGSFASMAARYEEEWLGAILPRKAHLDGQLGGVKPGGDALDALGAIAEHLHAVAPEGLVPAEGQLSKLKEDVSQLIVEVTDPESDLPAEVQHAVAKHLHEILSAIEHVAIGGPEAVRRALESLIGSVVIEQPAATRSRSWKATAAVLFAVWTAFTAAPTVDRSLEAWNDIGERVGVLSAPEQADPADGDPDNEGHPAEH